DANPDWVQYQEGALLCKRNIEGFLKENKEAWGALLAQFRDQPEFLKIMAAIDLPLYTSLTNISAGFPSDDKGSNVSPPEQDRDTAMAKPKDDSQSRRAPTDATSWLLEAARRVPALNYAIAVVGLVAASAISIGFVIGQWEYALFGGIAVFGGMVRVRL